MSFVDKLANFDLESRTSLLYLLIIIGVWAGITATEFLFQYEDCKSFGIRDIGICTDYGERLALLYLLDYESALDHETRFAVYWILLASNDLFGDYRVIPMISSGLLLVLTFLFTKEVTKRNYTGLVAVLWVLHSPIFYKYDAVLTYPSMWATLLLFSLYVLYKPAWFVSPLTMISSLPVKILNVLNFPIVILFILFSDLKDRKKKLVVCLSAFAGFIGFIVVASKIIIFEQLYNSVNALYFSQFKFQPIEFLWELGMWSIELSSDRISIVVFLFCLIGLYLLRRAKVPNSTALLLLIFITAVIQPALIAGFTIYTIEDYRFLHLIVFLGVSIGLILPNLQKIKEQLILFTKISR